MSSLSYRRASCNKAGSTPISIKYVMMFAVICWTPETASFVFKEVSSLKDDLWTPIEPGSAKRITPPRKANEQADAHSTALNWIVDRPSRRITLPSSIAFVMLPPGDWKVTATEEFDRAKDSKVDKSSWYAKSPDTTM